MRGGSSTQGSNGEDRNTDTDLDSLAWLQPEEKLILSGAIKVFQSFFQVEKDKEQISVLNIFLILRRIKC